MSGGLAFQGRVHGEHDLVDAAGRDAADELIDAEIIRTDALECRKSATKHLIAARKKARTVERPKVGYLLDDAQHLLVTTRILADGARIGCVDISADGTGRELVGDVL